jgi:hypothetical protein
MSQGPKKDKDHLADKLASFAAGEHPEDQPAGSGVEGHAQVHFGPAAPRPAPVPTPRPAPLPTATTRPAAIPPPADRPTIPARPAAAPRTPPPAKVRDSAPGTPPVAPRQREFHVVADEPDLGPDAAAAAHEAEIAREADAVAHVVEDDDTLNLPAPSPDMLAHRRPSPSPPRRPALSRTVGFKQTLIPILLTMGVLLPVLAFWSFAMGEESPISAAPSIALALIATGVVMLIFAIITMVQVKHQVGGSGGGTG